MIWHSSWAFLLLVPLVLFALLLLFVKRQKRPTVQFSSLSLLKKMQPGLRARLAFLPMALKFIALVLAIVALARPQKADERVTRNVEGIDIMFALDISDSMLIEDMRPENRLQSAKATISNFIKQRTSDRMGLLVFAGESYTRVPLTLDYPLLQARLKDVQTTRNIKMGTALGVALANSVARMKDSTAKSRVIIFLTDGENNSGTIDPITALDIVKGYKIRVYTIGVGRDGPTKIPVFRTDDFGNTYKRYQAFYSKVNETLLKKMANESGGKYYRAESTNVLQNVFVDISRLETSKIDIEKFLRFEEMFPIWLQSALILYALSLILAKTVFWRAP